MPVLPLLLALAIPAPFSVAIPVSDSVQPRVITVQAPLVAPLVMPVDTPVVRRRPRAIEHSDAYYTRLTIHRWGSYAMLPLFAAEYSLGQNLTNDASPPGWMKPAHSAVAGGIGVLFGVNTITGAWNWWEARGDPGSTRRTAHSVIMLASDLGFAISGAIAPGGHQQFRDYTDYQRRVRRHRNVALGSIALSTVGGAMMYLWKQ